MNVSKQSYSFFLSVVLDLCSHFLTRNISYKDYREGNYKSNKRREKVNSTFIPIKFCSSDVEKLDLNSVLNDKEALSLLPVKDLTKKFSDSSFRFSTCYKYNDSIRHKILNYKSVILKEDSEVKCFCYMYSNFIDKSVGHVVSGKCDIIQSRKLRNIFQQGLKYVEPLFVSKKEMLCSIISDIKYYFSNLAQRNNVSMRFFDGYISTVKERLSIEISKIKVKSGVNVSVFERYEDEFSRLKEHFVLSSVDKASNNISFTCKKFYIDNLDRELNSTDTYVISELDKKDIIKKHVMFCESLGIDVKDMELPFLHTLPKFHKPCLDFRYIAAGKKCTLKPLSKILTSILKLLDNTVRVRETYFCKFKNINTYWICKNKEACVERLDFENRNCVASSLRSFDFKKLYTNIPHKDVIDKICMILKECFEVKEAMYINLNKSLNAKWSIKKSGKYSFSEANIRDMFEFLIENIFVTFGNRVYRQVIGVPMGCDCAPQVADLYLHYYEKKFVLDNIDNSEINMSSFKSYKRYIDDLFTPNTSEVVSSKVINDIYPECLQIVQTNNDIDSATFLDLDVSVGRDGFEWHLYDKRRDFPFRVITFPNIKSNISTTNSYNIIIGELYRIAKSSSKLKYFLNDSKLFLSKLLNQNYKVKYMKRVVRSFLNIKPACINRYWYNFKTSDFFTS